MERFGFLIFGIISNFWKRARRTKGLQLDVRAQRAPRLLVDNTKFSIIFYRLFETSQTTMSHTLGKIFEKEENTNSGFGFGGRRGRLQAKLLNIAR